MNDMLMAGKVQVIFRKKENNLIRTLLCTLNPKFIPPESMKVLAEVAGTAGDRFIVWDVEKNDWRSFYIDSVIDFFPVKQDN